jgi:TPP-dependent pyruvate/acetoin dehydrogenase alpha subunit
LGLRQHQNSNWYLVSISWEKMSELDSEKLLAGMLRIRRIEEALAERYSEQEMRCPMHLCIGQEAIAIGVCAALAQGDKVLSNHRAHGHYLARGGSLKAMIAELYGRTTGCCGGRGGSMHLIDLDVGFLGATPIVGGTVPLAVGSAWASALRKDGCVSVVFFGDGCFEEGVVHESMNFAALHKLPIIFVCENNDFSVYTRRELRQPDRPIFRIAEAHGLASFAGDGNDVEAVVALAQTAVNQARLGNGPQFLELRTYRWREHCGPDFDDHLNYRPSKEIELGLLDCPVERYKAYLRSINIDADTLSAQFEKTIQKEIGRAFEFAFASPNPTPEQSWNKIYA